MKCNEAIGVFDSGIGGLTIVKALENKLPNENFIYFGDTLHMPYGEKTPEQILNYSKNIVEFLLSKNVKLIVIACNSASSIAASALRSEYWKQVEIIGVIRPVIKFIMNEGILKLGIIGTQATINSNIYANIIAEYPTQIELYQKATPNLAALIEQGKKGSSELKDLIQSYLSDEHFKDKEAILLACTHYPLIREEISNYFNNEKRIFDNASPLANEVEHFLIKNNLLTTNTSKENKFYVSRFNSNFEQVAQTFYGAQINVQEVKIH